MKKYISLVLSKEGKIKIILQNAFSKEELRFLLKRKNYFLLRTIKLKNLKIKEKEKLNFFIKLRIFVESGYQFYDAINSFEKRKGKKFYIEKMKKLLKKGEKIELIFRKSGLNLKKIDLIILKSGEESGNLVKSFLLIEKRLKKRLELKNKIKKIMLYPKVLVGFIVFILIFLGKMLLPNFVEILSEMNIKTSKTTILIIWFSDNFIFIILALFFLKKIIFEILKKPLLKNKIEKYILKSKKLDQMFMEIYKQNFLEALLVLLKANITIVQAIEILEKEEKNLHFRKKLNILLFNFKNGKNIENSFEKSGIFNNSELDFIYLGEKSGEIVKVLKIISDSSKSKIENKIDVFIKLLEPFTIIIIGIVILFVFKGIYFPLLKMIDNF